MKKLVLSILAIVGLCAAPEPAHAVFTFTLSQAGNNVTLTGSGSLNLTGLTVLNGNSSDSTAIVPSVALLFGGPAGSSSHTTYSGLSGPVTFGNGGYTSASAGSGNFLGLQGSGGYLYVPVGYVSGAALSDTSTFNNSTFASLGFTPGTYTYTLPSGDTLRVIGGVPEPSTWALLGAGALGACVVALHRRRVVRG